MSKFNNMTPGDVAAVVVEALQRGEDVDTVSLDTWFGSASDEDAQTLLVALTKPSGSGGYNDPLSIRQRAYRSALQKLNIDLNKLNAGWFAFLQRRHNSRGTPDEQAAAEHEYNAAVACVAPRTVTGVLGKHTRSYYPKEVYGWYSVEGVEVCPAEGSDTTSISENDDGTETKSSTADTRRELLGDDPDQLLGHVVEVMYQHKDDVNAALDKISSKRFVDEHTVSALRIID
jgi:hypothetical protein